MLGRPTCFIVNQKGDYYITVAKARMVDVIARVFWAR